MNIAGSTGATGLSALLTLGLWLTGCLDASLLADKECDPDGRCLAGYVCDRLSNTCVSASDLPDGGDGDGADGSDGTDGSDLDGADGDTQIRPAFSNLDPAAMALFCENEQSLHLTGDATLDTATGVLTIGGQDVAPAFFGLVDQVNEDAPDLAVLSYASIEIQPTVTLSVTGPNGLVLLACSTLTVKGTIAASGTAGQMQADGTGLNGRAGPGGFAGGAGNGGAGRGPGGGAGGPAADCDPTLDSGGSGGGHWTVGGLGGTADGGQDCQQEGPAGGPGYGLVDLRPLMGGSGGGGGADGAGGPGGGGGGAIQLASGSQIYIHGGGAIIAGGGGGAGGHDGVDSSAGGAGGAGGAILLEAPLVEIEGSLISNGGGGGAGFGENDAFEDRVAASGEDGRSDGQAAQGGVSEGFGGSGGAGGAGDSPAGKAGQAGQNGGGGGGSAGRIRINTSTGQATFSDTPTLSPSDDPTRCTGPCSQGLLNLP